jgi:hypothetical protein
MSKKISSFLSQKLKPRLLAYCLVALALIVIASLLVTHAAAPPAADGDKMIGINGTTNEDRFMVDAANLGVKWARVEQWGDNANYDTVPSTLNRLNANNIRMMPLVNNYQVGWVTSADKQTWVDQLVHTATTYGKGGTYWQGKVDLGSPVIELGNEVYGKWYSWPNQSYLFPGEYAKMAKQAAIAVSAATNGRVRLIVSVTGDYQDTNDLSGGSAGTWKSWSNQMKAAVPDIETYIAGVAVHPYGDVPAIGIGTRTDPNFSHQVLYTIHGLWGVPVYVTEVGQKGPAVGFDKQAAAMDYYFDELKNNSWEAGFFWYNQKDYQAYNPNGDNGWALIDYQDNRVQAWYTYQQRATTFAATAPKAGDLNGDGKVTVLDLSIVLSNYGKQTTLGDCNNDGKVTIVDLSTVLSNYGR